MKNRNSPFNNEVEYGLRALSILMCGFPRKYDLNALVYLDYFLVNSGDFEMSVKSLHAPIPQRKEGIYIRRSLLEKGVKLYSVYGLIVPRYLSSGMYFLASELAEPFMDSLSEEYTLLLRERAEWTVNTFGDCSMTMMKNYLKEAQGSNQQDIAFEVELIKEQSWLGYT